MGHTVGNQLKILESQCCTTIVQGHVTSFSPQNVKKTNWLKIAEAILNSLLNNSIQHLQTENTHVIHGSM